MSPRSRWLRLWLRATMRRYMAHMQDPVRLRTQMARVMARAFRPPPFSLGLPATVGGVRGLWVSNRPAADPVVLYFHGGGYFFGSAHTHRAMLSQLAQRTGLRVFAPDYRLAPEHPFPAAFDDAVAVWEGLLGQGYEPGQIVLGGDSAGGGLALSLLAQLCLTDIRALILGGARPHEAGDPRLSPLYASFASPPPVRIFAAETEILRDDSLRMRNRLPDAEIKVSGDLPHVWPMFHDTLPEARQTLDDTAAFIRQALALPPGGN